MCHQDDPHKDRADQQVVSLLAIDIAILRREGKGIVERQTCEIEVDAVLDAHPTQTLLVYT
jgi:hypothetical protein